MGRETCSEDRVAGSATHVFDSSGPAAQRLPPVGTASAPPWNWRRLKRADAQSDVRELGVRLDAAAKRLRAASAAGKSAVLTDMLTHLSGYPEFTRLPQVCQKALEDGFIAIANTRPCSSWRSSMDTLGSYYFSVDRLNFNPAMVRLGNDLKDFWFGYLSNYDFTKISLE